MREKSNEVSYNSEKICLAAVFVSARLSVHSSKEVAIVFEVGDKLEHETVSRNWRIREGYG